MELQKFGVKLFLNTNGSFDSKDFIPVFHTWIQNKVIVDHLLIDVADYSHIPDGPGVMLIAHEGHFSLDQENLIPGIMYMRKTETEGSFKERFMKVLSTTRQAANRLCNNNINKGQSFSILTGIKQAGLMAYIKKGEYGPAEIIAKNLKFNSTDQHAVVQKENKISIDGIEVLPTDLDVEKLYSTSDNL